MFQFSENSAELSSKFCICRFCGHPWKLHLYGMIQLLVTDGLEFTPESSEVASRHLTTSCFKEHSLHLVYCKLL